MMETPTPTDPVRRNLVLLLLLTAVLYIRVAGYAFVWDDTYFIVENPAVQDPSSIPGYFTDIETSSAPYKAAEFRVYRPLRNLSYLLDYSLFGLNPAGWHLHNLALHLLNGALVFSLFRALGGKKTAALFAGAVFLLHPLQTEVVAWVKGRDDLLAATGCLLGALLILRPRTPGLLGASHALSCLAKVQSVIVLPALLWWKPQADRKARAGALGLMGGSLAYLILRHVVLGGSGQTDYLAGGFFPTLLRMGPVLVNYLRLFLIPVGQLADYIHLLDAPASLSIALASWAAILLIVLGFLCTARKQPALLFAGVWVAAAMLPVMNLVPMMQYMAERFLYLPMVGMCLIAGYSLEMLEQKSRRVSMALAVVTVVLLAGLTHLRLPVWANEVALFRSVVEDAPVPHFRPHRNLLGALLDSGQLEEADRVLNRMSDLQWEDLEQAQMLYLESRLYQLQQRPPTDIIPLLQKSQSLDPTNASVLEDLGILTAVSGDPAQAIDLFTQAISLQPWKATLYGNRALAYRAVGEAPLAEEDFRRSLQIRPLRQNVLGLASLLWSQQRFAEAKETYESGLKDFPGDEEMMLWRDRAGEMMRRSPSPVQ